MGRGACPGSLAPCAPTSSASPTTPARVQAWAGDRLRDRPDRLVTEEPMEIRIDGAGPRRCVPLAVVMRTPGHDFELAVGFCITEGIIDSGADLAEVRYCLGPDAEQEYNVVTVATRRPVDLDGPRRATSSAARAAASAARPRWTSSRSTARRSAPGPTVPMATVLELPDRLRAGADRLRRDRRAARGRARARRRHRRASCARTSAGTTRSTSSSGTRRSPTRLPLSTSVLVVSGRASFEIVQKAARAGITTLVAVSAPSSLAVATAERFGMTLVGFVRDGRANVYTGDHRITT